MTDVKRALRLGETQGHPQAFADSAKYDCLFKNPFHSRLAPCTTFLFPFFFLFFLCVWGCVCRRARVCCWLSLFLSFFFFFLLLFFFFPNGRKRKGLKAPGAEYHQLLQRLVGEWRVLRIWLEECSRNACCWVWVDLLAVGFIRIV